MEVPIFTELANAGMAGICLALIGTLCYIVRTFVGAYKEISQQLFGLNQIIAELRADIHVLTMRRRRKKRDGTQITKVN